MSDTGPERAETTDDRRAPRFLLFDEFRLDTVERRLYRHSDPIELTPRSIELLLAFLEQPGELLSRTDLLQRVWPGRYVEDANLTQGVFVLRKALGGGDDGHRFILTEPGVGYRFACEIRTEDGPAPERGQDAPSPDVIPPKRTSPPTTEPRPATLRIAGGLLAAAVVVAFGWYLSTWSRPASSTPPLSEVASLAVLPFVDLESRDPSPMGLGMADALIARLGQDGSLVVRPLPTVLDYQQPRQLPEELGRRLQTEAVLVGTLLRTGGELRATIQLIETAGGRTLWAETFRQPESEPFALQKLVVETVSRALLSPTVARTVADTTSPETDSFDAYEALMLGRYWLAERDGESLDRARDAFDRATRIDSDYPAAWAGLADAELLLGFYYQGDGDTVERYRRAKAHAEQALRLDPDLASAHTVIGMYELAVGGDLEASRVAFERALALAPDSARAHHWYSWYLLSTGRPESAAQAIERAHQIDPLSMIIRSARGLVAYYRRQYAKSLEDLDAALAVREDFGRGHLNRGLALEQLGRLDEAQSALTRARELLGGSSEVDAALAHLAFARGDRERALELIDGLRSRGAAEIHLAIAFAPVDETTARKHLKQAVTARTVWPWVVRYEPRLESLGRAAESPADNSD